MGDLNSKLIGRLDVPARQVMNVAYSDDILPSYNLPKLVISTSVTVFYFGHNQSIEQTMSS